MNLHNSKDLDRLISGEIPIEDENDLIAACEASPEHWRSVALGMIEHRQIERMLREASPATHTADSITHVRWPASPGTNKRTLGLAATAATVLALVASGVAYRMGQDAKLQQSGVSREGSPIIVQIQQPVRTRIQERVPEPILSPEIHQLLQEAGLAVEEEVQLRWVDQPNGTLRAVPDRKFRVQNVKL